MPPAVHVDPARGCEHCEFVPELLQHPEFPGLPPAEWRGRYGVLGHHQIVVVKVALRRLEAAQVSCGEYLCCGVSAV